jgi:hypothetical protein
LSNLRLLKERQIEITGRHTTQKGSFMHKPFYFRLLTSVLSFQLMLPQISLASPKEALAVVEIHKGIASKDLSILRGKLERHLMEARKRQLVPAEKIVAYFQGETDAGVALTEGDHLVNDAETHFLNFEFKEAIAVATRATTLLQKQPGMRGGFFKANMLKAQAHLELGDTSAAATATEMAIAANVEAKALDAYAYPPKIQSFYKKVFAAYSQHTKLVDLTVSVRGGKSSDIYINGIKRGQGPSVTLKVPEGALQYVAAGSISVVGAMAVKADSGSVTVTGKEAPVQLMARKPIGFKNADRTTLVENAIGLGAGVGADKVVLLSLSETNLVSRLTVSVVDVTRSAATQEKQIDLVDVSSDGDSATSVAADYITGLSKGAYAKVETSQELPVLIGKKKHKMSPALLGVLGAIVLGAGTGIALAMGGGSSGSSDTSTTVSVSTAQPSSP